MRHNELLRVEMQTRMRAAWRKTVHLCHVDNCGVTGADAQLILASSELHQPPATEVQSPARSLFQEYSVFCSLLSTAFEFFDERHGS